MAADAALTEELVDACEKGHVDVVTRLAKEGVDLNRPSKKDWTPLQKAARWNQIDAGIALIENNADIDLGDDAGFNPLFISTNHGHPFVHMLISHKANVQCSTKDRKTPLLQSSEYGFLKIAKHLIHGNADVNHIDKNGVSALIWASRNGHQNVVETVLRSKADINHQAKESNDVTALMEAAKQGHPNVIGTLLFHDADANLKNQDGHTAVEIAELSGQPHIKNMLKLNLGTFQVIFSNKDFHKVRLVQKSDETLKYEAHITFPGIDMNVLLKVPKHKAGEEEWNELSVLNTLPNDEALLTFLGVCTDFSSKGSDAKPAVVVPYGRPVRTYAYKKDSLKLSETELVGIVLDMAKSLEAFHKNQFIHSNVTADSFMVLQKSNRTVLADFRRAYSTNSTPTVTSEHPHWRCCSPETLEGKVEEFKSDVWMFGISIWQLLAKTDMEPFYQFTSRDSLIEYIKKNEYFSDLQCHNCPIFQDILNSCCTSDIESRPAMSEVCQMIRDLTTQSPESESKDEEKQIDDFSWKQKEDETQSNELFKAIKAQDAEKVASLIDSGVDVNLARNTQWSPLMEAIRYATLEIVHLLVQAKADVDHQDKYHHVPIAIAAIENREDIWSFLASNGANVHTTNFPSWKDMLEAAIPDQNLEFTKLLTKAGISPNFKREIDGSTPLSSGSQEIREYLNGNKSGVFEEKATMLIHASYSGHTGMVKLMLSHGIDVTWKDNKSKTATDYAAERGHWKIVAYLQKVRPPPLEVTFYSFGSLKDVSTLSSGQFGATYRAAIDSVSGTSRLVCKVAKAGAGSDEWFELQVLKNITAHPSVLNLVGLCMDFLYEDLTVPAILVPFMEGGSLRSVVDNLMKTKCHLGATTVVRFALDMAESLHHLHLHDCIHRDIALRNFLLSNKEVDAEEQRLVIADFGLSRFLKDTMDQTSFSCLTGGQEKGTEQKGTEQKGTEQKCDDEPTGSDTEGDNYTEVGGETPVTYDTADVLEHINPGKKLIYRCKPDELLPWRWCAPETLMSAISSKESDVYMLGVTIWEMLGTRTSTKPFTFSTSMRAKLDASKKAHMSGRLVPLAFPIRCPDFVKNVVNQMCNFDSAKRWSSSEAVTHLQDLLKQNPGETGIQTLFGTTPTGTTASGTVESSSGEDDTDENTYTVVDSDSDDNYGNLGEEAYAYASRDGMYVDVQSSSESDIYDEADEPDSS